MDLAEYYECVAAKELFVKHLKELQNKKLAGTQLDSGLFGNDDPAEI